jgi:hypothetical protein
MPEVVIGRRSFLRLAGFSAGMSALSQLRWTGSIRPCAAGHRPSPALPRAAGEGPSSPLPCEAGEGQGGGSVAPALHVLSEGDARILSAIAERMVFTGDPAMPRFAETSGLAAIDAALTRVDPDVVDQLHWGLLLFEYGPPLFGARFSTFTGLDEKAQDDYLAGWEASRFATRRLVFQALKNLSFLGYYSQDATWKGIHYDGPWIPRPRMGAGT